ncbi:hypothetical protein [uncultured Ruegeria sp.]|uniref:hypothetical protein n=1 Tax=uncultured Ruegeria sp. TaxID=259304 RepID=UPI00261B358D|nr:hypothetical protein [uncultured Ruegeria sp.]
MQKHLNKLASSAACIGLFLIDCVMAGLGLVVMFYLVLFALVAAALGLLAAPLLGFVGQTAKENAEKVAA